MFGHCRAVLWLVSTFSVPGHRRSGSVSTNVLQYSFLNRVLRVRYSIIAEIVFKYNGATGMVEARAAETKRLVDRILQAQQSASELHPYLKILELSPGFQDVELRRKKELASLLHPESMDGTLAHLCGGWDRVCRASCLLEAAVKDAEQWLCSRSTATSSHTDSQYSDDSRLKHRLWEVTLDAEFTARKLLRDLDSKIARPDSQQQATRQQLQEDARSTQTSLKMPAGRKRDKELPEEEPNEPRKKRRDQGDCGSPLELGQNQRQERAKQQATDAKVQEKSCHNGCVEECEHPVVEQGQQTKESNLEFALRKQQEELQRLQGESQKTRSDAYAQPRECPSSSDKSSCARATSDLPGALCRGAPEIEAASTKMARNQPVSFTSLWIIGQVTEVLLNCATQHGQGFSGVTLEEFCSHFRQLVGMSLDESVLLVQESNLLCFLRKWPEKVELFMDTETCSWMLQPCAKVQSSAQQQQLMRAS